MKVTEIPFEFAPQTEQKSRSKGLHLSTIVRAIERDILGEEKRPAKDPAQERRMIAMWEAGLVWERAFEIATTERYGRERKGLLLQEELLVDGVYLTPDCYDTIERCIEEYKWTRVSLASIEREGFEKRWPGYLISMKAYCRARKTTKAKLIVFFVNGNYKWGTPEGEPTPKKWLFEFTRQELEENWLLVLRKRGELLKVKGASDGQRAAGAVRRPLVLGSNRGDRVPDLGRAVGAEAREGTGGGEVEAVAERLPWLNFSGLDRDDED